ncbi:activating transcription factor 7a [Beauveria brongniartii RCEF 3172]|uniref:Activating transcription factor 7a n=1 Tax=Beauveria brongniartii RCEF 3172 TaxID=1081107 RepID=A0A166VVE5_9HYPO|nr:activating transcription factor 7a [Beauveria brongniartii RCEF 3172]
MLDGDKYLADADALLQQRSVKEDSTFRTTHATTVMRLSMADSELDGNDDDDGDAYQSDSFSAANKHSARSKKVKTHAATSSNSKSVLAAKDMPAKSRKTGGGTAEKRRRHNLERNCAAASKCRQRKRQWQEGLESEKKELEERCKHLHVEAEEIIEEIAQLKDLVMAHAGCDNTNIDIWLQNEADSFVRRMSTTHGTWSSPAIGGSVSATAVSIGRLYQLPATDVAINDGSKTSLDPGSSYSLWHAATDNIFNQDSNEMPYSESFHP